jgi:hypothetical protein
MQLPRVVDGGDGLQMWRAAANILNKQPRKANKGWSSSWGLGVGMTTSHHKKSILRNVTQNLERRRWEDNIKMGLREIGWGGCTGFFWLRIGTSTEK